MLLYNLAMKFSIVIPVFNHPEYTKLCLDSVAQSSAEIVVVDNGSIGKTRAILSSYGSRITIIRNETNLGIAIALNQGVAAATTNSIVMLHNDCIVLEGFEAVVSDCFEQMESKNIKLVSPLTNYCDEPTFVWSKELLDHFASCKLCNKSRPTTESIRDSLDRAYARYGGLKRFAGRITKFPLIASAGEVSSFCMLTEKEAFSKVGGFSDKFKFRGCEDKELLCRYNQNGFRPGRAGFFVHHFGNITSDGPGFNSRQLMDANDKIFVSIKGRYEVHNSWTAVVFPDKEPSLMNRAKANLLDLDWPPDQIIEIPHPGMFPIRKAWEWAIPKIKHNAFGRLDADMLLKRNAIYKMLDPFKDFNVAMTSAYLEDPCIGKIGSLIFWQTAAFKSIDHGKTPALDYERFYLAEIKRAGMRVEWIDEILADHALILDPWVIFKAFFRRGLKRRSRGLGIEDAVDEISGALKKGGPWSHLAMLAFHTGLKIDYNLDPHDEAYEAFAMEHYKHIQPFCEKIVDGHRPAKTPPKPDPRIRVALLSACLDIGGMEVVIKLLDEMIDHSKFNLFIYSTIGGALENDFKCKNIRIARIPRNDKKTYQRMREWLVQDKIEVAVNMALANAGEVFVGGKSCRVIERTDGSSFKYIETPGITDQVVFESDYMKKLLPKFPCTNHVTITNGRKPFVKNEEARKSIRQKLGMKEDDLLVVNIARLCEVKNQQHLVLMAQELKKRGHGNFKLVIMGTDRQGVKDKLEMLISETEMEQTVFIFDETCGVPEMLSAADIFATASLTEGLSGALVEACVAGVPIVSSNVGASAEVVQRNGILFPVNDLPALITAMEKMLTNHEFRKSAAEASLELAESYSAAKMVKEFERIIEEQALIHRKEKQQADPMDSNRITILLPCKDQKREFLEDAIDSVVAQTCSDWNMLVVMEADTPEDIKNIVLSYNDDRIKLVISDARPGTGVAGALNAGVRKTHTAFACVLLSHDRLDKEAIAVLKRSIKENPDVDFFHSSRAYMNAAGEVQHPTMNSIESFSENHFKTIGSPVKHLLCWNVAAGRASGGMDDELGLVGSDDYDFPWTMYEAGCEFKAIKECLYYYRVHHDFYRGTTNLPIEKHIEILRKMFKKHGVSDIETESFIEGAYNYVVADKCLNFDTDMSGIAKRVRHGHLSADRKDEFVASGHLARNFFPHKAHVLPKSGPDSFRLAQRTCGISDPSKAREIVLYADDEVLEEFPRTIFFDKDLIWHEQQFGRNGHVAVANLTIATDTIYGNAYFSDIYQRISRRREHKTRIEKIFQGWPHMLFNAIMDFAAENKFKRFLSPTADKIVSSCIDKSRTVDRAMFDAVYDRKLLECFEAVEENGFWSIDVEKNAGRIVPLRMAEEIIEMEKTICVCHDIEQGLGHENVDGHDENVVQEMLAAEKGMGIKATYNVVGCIMNKYRAMIEKDGHCVAFHSFNHCLAEEQLLRCREVDYRIKGYRPPQSKLTEELGCENLCFHNFEWIASSAWANKRIPVMEEGIVKIPIVLDDFALANGTKYEAWEREALRRIRENYFVAFSLHDCYSQHWLPHYRQFLGKIAKMGKFKTLDEVSGEMVLANAI